MFTNSKLNKEYKKERKIELKVLKTKRKQSKQKVTKTKLSEKQTFSNTFTDVVF